MEAFQQLSKTPTKAAKTLQIIYQILSSVKAIKPIRVHRVHDEAADFESQQNQNVQLCHNYQS